MRNVFPVLVVALLLSGCGSENPTEPESPQGSVYLSRLVVAMVPGRSEAVSIIPSVAGQCWATSADPSIAHAEISGSSVVITGVSFGTTTVTVTDAAHQSCDLPVQVYDYSVLDTGELLVTFTDQFEYISSRPAGSSTVTFWKPIAPAGYSVLGTYMKVGTANPSGYAAVMVVKAKPGSSAVVMTNNFQITNGVLHNPVAPQGYKALGQVYVPQSGSPYPVACVREDLTTPGSCYLFLTYYGGTGESGWHIDQPNASYHEGAYLASGMTIYRIGAVDEPIGHSSANVLKVELPMLAEAPAQEYRPSLTSYSMPQDGAAPSFEKAMLVPCTIVKDAAHDSDMPWRITNSPFYRLERQVYYKVINHYDNSQGSERQSFEWEISNGISETESMALWNETAVDLSQESGLSIAGSGTKITATVSRNFGYQSMTSVTELRSSSLNVTVNVPAHKASALYQQYSRFVLYRHNGPQLELVKSWECGIMSWFVDEYPD